MKIFIDTANIGEIMEINSIGILDGVTTNPTLLKKAVDELKSQGKNVNIEDYIEDICKTLGKGKPVSLEVVSTVADKMVEEAKLLYERFNPVASNVVIKIPVSTCTSSKDDCYEGLKAIGSLKKERIPVNATLVMTPEQALLVAKAGASYASPFLGRIDDYIRKKMGGKFEKGDYFPVEGLKQDDNGVRSGIDLLRKIVNIYNNYNLKTEVIAASLRNTRQVREASEAGAHIATIPFKVIGDMLKHHKTMEGVRLFTEDVTPEYKELFD